MYCPYCRYTSFDHLPTCPKCNYDWSEIREVLGIDTPFLPPDTAPKDDGRTKQTMPTVPPKENSQTVLSNLLNES